MKCDPEAAIKRRIAAQLTGMIELTVRHIQIGVMIHKISSAIQQDFCKKAVALLRKA